MNSDAPILLLRGKLGISVVVINAIGAPKLLTWIPANECSSLLGALKISPRKNKRRQPSSKSPPADIRYESFREELLK